LKVLYEDIATFPVLGVVFDAHLNFVHLTSVHSLRLGVNHEYRNAADTHQQPGYLKTHFTDAHTQKYRKKKKTGLETDADTCRAAKAGRRETVRSRVWVSLSLSREKVEAHSESLPSRWCELRHAAAAGKKSGEK
jgi:hypothetical protein